MSVTVRILLIVIVVLILAVVSLFVINKAEQSREELPYFGQIPPFEFLTQDSTVFTQAALLGKISIVDFIFTRCKGPCPVMAVHMGDLYTTYSSDADIQMISISVDPDYDSLSVLRNYAKMNNVTDNRWVFLRNELPQVVDLCENGFKLPAEDLPGMHTTKFILVDQQGYIRGYYSGTEAQSIELLKQDIKRLEGGQS